MFPITTRVIFTQAASRMPVIKAVRYNSIKRIPLKRTNFAAREKTGFIIFSFFWAMGYQPRRAKKRIPGDFSGSKKDRSPAAR